MVNHKISPGGRKRNHFLIMLISLLVFTPLVPLSSATQYPDLVIDSISAPANAIEYDDVTIIVNVKNIGTINASAGIAIDVELSLDYQGIVVVRNTTMLGLTAGATRSFNLTWKATVGVSQQRILNLRVTYHGTEENTNNNDMDKTISVTERPADLSFAEPLYINGIPRIGTPSMIYTNITNIGKNITQSINVTLFIDGNYAQHHLINGLKKHQAQKLIFQWTPTTLGNHVINITIDPKKTIQEYTKTNNYQSTQVFVTTTNLAWWDSNWHYRRIYEIQGTGNISRTMNFTALLTPLNVTEETFENTTITIIKYTSNGTLVDVIQNYTFIEDDAYHPIQNAKGKLIWEINSPGMYCVYFDVKKNIGTRTSTPELPDMNTSGNPHITLEGVAEGWWTYFSTPMKTYYAPFEVMTITVNTTAKARTVTAEFYYNNQYEDTKILIGTGNTSWTTTTILSNEGNWSIHIKSLDDAGYSANPLIFEFFVGYPDLTVNSITFSSKLPEGSPFYENTTITIQADIRTTNASVSNVTAAFYVNNLLVSNKTNLTITKATANPVTIDRSFPTKGTYSITIVVDPDNKIKEANEKNNNKSKSLLIEGKPDLGIVNIIIPSTPVDEGEPVTIYTNIRNTGHGNATNYTVNLYIDPDNEQNQISYVKLRNNTKINVKINETKNVSIVWERSDYGSTGKWIVGIKVLYDDATHPDLNKSNNTKARFDKKLTINKSDNRPPVIQLQAIGKHERNSPVTITAKVTDTTGVKNVVIQIKNPRNEKTTHNLSKTTNDYYTYTYLNTNILGIYTFWINATDTSFFENTSTLRGTFEIIEDQTPPTIDYFNAHPYVQLTGKNVEIRCITHDKSLIKQVTVQITFPDREKETRTLTSPTKDEKYTYTASYDINGKYELSLTVEDNAGNIKTGTDEFWITPDLNDTDNDGMDDRWEKRYGFDPYDPSDADLDSDEDGYTNIEEYEKGMNPLKMASSLQDISQKLGDNIAYLAGSCILFVITLILGVFGLRRKKP